MARCILSALRQVLAVHLAVVAVATTLLGAWWDPIWSAIDRTYQTATAPLRAAISTLAGWIADIFDMLRSAVDAVANLADLALSAVSDTATAIWSALYNVTVNAIPGAIRTVLGVVDSVRSILMATINAAVGAVSNTVVTLYNAAVGSAHALFDTLSGYLTRAVDDLHSWVMGPVLGVVRGIVTTALSPVFGAINLVRSAIAAGIDSVTAWARPTVELVGRTTAWLLWFATHPFDYLRGILSDLAHLGSRSLLSLFADALSRDGGMLEQWLADWLGK